MSSEPTQQAEVSQLYQALGLMSTIKPSMLVRIDDPIGMAEEVVREVDQLRAELAKAQTITGETSDGYHTFDELYKHRCLLFAWVLMYTWNGFKTRKNDKGEEWPGWFIAGVNTPFGQITYHLPDELWDLVLSQEIERNIGYDGHTSNDVIERMTQVLKDMAGNRTT
jgi:hypothetical protein